MPTKKIKAAVKKTPVVHDKSPLTDAEIAEYREFLDEIGWRDYVVISTSEQLKDQDHISDEEWIGFFKQDNGEYQPEGYPEWKRAYFVAGEDDNEFWASCPEEARAIVDAMDESYKAEFGEPSESKILHIDTAIEVLREAVAHKGENPGIDPVLITAASQALYSLAVVTDLGESFGAFGQAHYWETEVEELMGEPFPMVTLEIAKSSHSMPTDKMVKKYKRKSDNPELLDGDILRTIETIFESYEDLD